MTKSLPSLLALIVLGIALLSPIPSQAISGKEKEQAGATLFRDKGCAYCHGANAQGTQKGPSLANIRKTWQAPRITDQILNGGQKMPAFQDSLSADEVARLVAYLRAKHRPAPAPVPTPAPTPKPTP